MADEYRDLSHKEQAILKLPVYFDSYDNYYHPIREVTTNSRDVLNESENGVIKVTLHDDCRTVTIEDNGCGIPLDGESGGKPNWEHAFLILFSGSKMSTGGTSGGTNGCGNTIINYTSDYMEITSKRDGKIYNLAFENGGDILKPFTCLGTTKEHGTTITFRLCADIYTNTVFEPNEVKGITERICATNPNITAYFTYSNETIEFNYKTLQDYLEFKIEDKTIKDIVVDEKTFDSQYYDMDLKRDNIENTTIKLVINACKEENSHYSFLNGIYLPELGTIHEGVVDGIRDSLNQFIKDNKLYDNNEKQITKIDVEETISYVCSVLSTNVSYTSQTKFATKKELYKNLTKQYLKEFLEVYSIEEKDNLLQLANRILINKRSREKAEQIKKSTKAKLSDEIKFTDDIKNFKNCITKDKNLAELYVGEGSSALGGILQSRKAFFQAGFHVGGKMLSLLKATEKQIFANDVVYNLYRIFGCGTHLYNSKYNVKVKNKPALPHFDIDNFNWKRIILATDQDIDAFQIRCLILCCIYRMSKELIEQGYIYIAEAPLYEITTKNKDKKKEETLFAYTDREKEDIMKDLDSKGIKYYPPERNKGLGQMAKDTMAKAIMNPDTRRLTQVTVSDVEAMEKVFELWLGDNVENRRDVITDNFDYVEHFDCCESKDVVPLVNENYLPYAIDIVKDRAIIAIDGFKPSHRKLLWTLHEKGLYDKRTKSANIVGDNMSYNVHGDGSIYQTLVRMAQDDTLLYPYVNGKGNFGLHTHNSKELQEAHMRYTEAGASNINREFFKDINKNAVKFMPNYDGQKQEPTLLPTTFPNLLVNYNEGIAVGMASKTPSFNLNEVIDTTIAYIQNKDINISDYLIAPDFATKGEVLYDKEELENIYNTGKGSVTLRAKYKIEDDNIIITEIPYCTNVEAIVSRIKELCIEKSQKYKVITNVIDTTELEGISITMEVKKNTNMEKLMAMLYKETSLESKQSFNMNIICLDGKPSVLSIKQILDEWLKFRKDCIKNVLSYDINSKSKTLHLLKGLENVLLNVDKAIEINRYSEENQVIPELMKEFKLDEEQGKYVYEMKLRNINEKFIENEIKDIHKLETEIKSLQYKLETDKELNNMIIKDLERVKKDYGESRRTEIVYKHEVEEIKEEVFIEEFTCTLILSEEGYFKKTRRYSETQKLKDGDEIKTIIQCSNKDKAIFISNQGNAYFLNLWEANEKQPSTLGDFLPNLLPLEKDETIIGMLTTNQYKGHVVYVFENSKIAKIPLSSFETKTNRTKLSNSITQENGKILLITQITDDIDIELTDCFDKTKIVNTKDINSKASKNTVGVTSWNCKKQDFKIVSANIITNKQ